MDCLRKAGRQRSYRDTVIYTTLSPCMMCTGTIILFKIPTVVIGECVNFGGNERLLRDHGVDVIDLNDAQLHRSDGAVHPRAAGDLERGYRGAGAMKRRGA